MMNASTSWGWLPLCRLQECPATPECVQATRNSGCLLLFWLQKSSAQGHQPVVVLATAGSHLELSQIAPDLAALEAMLASSMWGDDDLPAEVQAGKLALRAIEQLHVLGRQAACFVKGRLPDGLLGSIWSPCHRRRWQSTLHGNGTELWAAMCAGCRCRHPGPLPQTLEDPQIALQASQPMDTDGGGRSNSSQQKGFTLEKLLQTLQVR